MSENLENNTNISTKFIDKIKSYKKIIFSILILLIIISSSLFYLDFKAEKNLIIFSEKFNSAKILLREKKENEAKEILNNLINEKNSFYSPLALFFIIENKLEQKTEIIIESFDKILTINSIDKENINLIKLKKSIYLINLGDEQKALETLKPIINSDSVWRESALKILADYFLEKGEFNKSKEYLRLLKK